MPSLTTIRAAAAACAADQDRLKDFAVRGALQAALVWGMKEFFDGAPISYLLVSASRRV